MDAGVTQKEERGRSGEKDDEPMPRLLVKATPRKSAERGSAELVTQPWEEMWLLRRGNSSGLNVACLPLPGCRYRDRAETTRAWEGRRGNGKRTDLVPFQTRKSKALPRRLPGEKGLAFANPEWKDLMRKRSEGLGQNYRASTTARG